MPDKETNKQSDFMIEKIKERPVNKKKLLRRTIITASMAVIFGLIACLTFLILEPVFTNWLYPEEEPQVIIFPEDINEVAPEDMIVEDEEPDIKQAVENAILEDEQIQSILDNITLDLTNYKQLYSIMSEYVSQISQSIVTVTGITSDTDWFNMTYESRSQTSGVVIANNGKELLILTDMSQIKQVENLVVTFWEGEQVMAFQKAQDTQTGYAILGIPLTDMSKELLEEISIVTLGSSNAKNMIGSPVVALGSPMGSSGSLNYGMITGTASYQVVDSNYRLLLTDMYGSPTGSGVLFNLQGQVIGLLTTTRQSADMKNIITAIGITDLKKMIEMMSNGQDIAYLGVTGTDVTTQVHAELEVPYGAYVQEVQMNSPAMLAGIQSGDVIVRLGEEEINSVSDLTTSLYQQEPESDIEITVQRPVSDSYREVLLKITLE